VWENPVAWREAKTRASAGGRSALRWVFVVIGCSVALVLLAAHYQGWWGLDKVDSMRTLLVTVTRIEFVLILLITTSTAATSLTREKESQTMELLLCTPLTSLQILRGMLQGLMWFVLPLIAIPLITLGLFAGADLISRASEPVAAIESVIAVPLLIVFFCAAAAILGMQASLKARKTVQAVMTSTLIVLGLTAVLSGCALLTNTADASIRAFFAPFAPIQAIGALIDPAGAYDPYGAGDGPQIMAARFSAGVATLISAGLYAVITVIVYKSMERGFDMIMRRQAV
jgi:ABC-type Na+ efflux pump permease subunit